MSQPASSSEQQDRDRKPDIAFGDVVRRYRTEKELTQEQVSWNTGMSRVYISELERGLREPGLGTILKLARCFGVQASEIRTGTHKEGSAAVLIAFMIGSKVQPVVLQPCLHPVPKSHTYLC